VRMFILFVLAPALAFNVYAMIQFRREAIRVTELRPRPAMSTRLAGWWSFLVRRFENQAQRAIRALEQEAANSSPTVARIRPSQPGNAGRGRR
jgi:hypothetical protein